MALNIYLRHWVLGSCSHSFLGRATGLRCLICFDESPRISLLTSPYGIGHLVKEQCPNKLQFSEIPGIFPFLTPPFHTEPLGLGVCGCSPKQPWLVSQPLCARAVMDPRGSDIPSTW